MEDVYVSHSFVTRVTLWLIQLTRTFTFEDISGVPGTGKTATVHAVIRELKRLAENNVNFLVDPFAFELIRDITLRKSIHLPTVKSMVSESQNQLRRIHFYGRLCQDTTWPKTAI